MILSVIHNHYPKLTETEKKIAAAVLENPREITLLSIQELAARAGTAPSAVVRFCKSIGADGFSHLKLQIAEELGHHIMSEGMPAIQENDSNAEIFGKVFRSGMQTLSDTLSMIRPETVGAICRLLIEAKRIVFFGVGTSSVVAEDAAYRFVQIGLNATAVTDVVYMGVTAINLGKNDVAVGISHSGTTKPTVDTLRLAQTAGAATVALTSFEESILAKECDYVITAFSDEQNYPVEAVSARLAQFCIIDALMLAVASMNYDSFREHIAGRNEILRGIRY